MNLSYAKFALRMQFVLKGIKIGELSQSQIEMKWNETEVAQISPVFVK
jgi:hypothetical protein